MKRKIRNILLISITSVLIVSGIGIGAYFLTTGENTPVLKTSDLSFAIVDTDQYLFYENMSVITEPTLKSLQTYLINYADGQAQRD